MFSVRFYKLLYFVLNSTKPCHITLLRFNFQRKLLYLESNRKYLKKCYMNLLIALCWIVGLVIQCTYRYWKGDYNTMNLGLAFAMGGMLAVFVEFVMVFRAKEICQTINGLLIFFRYLHCKIINFCHIAKI